MHLPQPSGNFPSSTTSQRCLPNGQWPHLANSHCFCRVIHASQESLLNFPNILGACHIASSPSLLGMNYQVQRDRGGCIRPFMFSLDYSRSYTSPVSSLELAQIRPRAVIYMHYFLCFQGDGSVYNVKQSFLRSHPTTINSLVTHIDFGQ